MFSGKTLRDGILDRSRSADSVFIFAGDESQARCKKRKKRYEEWDAKGGFDIRISSSASSFQAKALTDVSMAMDMGVEATVLGWVIEKKKCSAATSPSDLKGDWSLKRSKTVSPLTLDENMAEATDSKAT